MGSANATNALQRVLSMRGPAICENVSLTEALLRDYCPDDRPGVHCLMSALRERVPQSILSAAPNANREALRGILRERLQNACHMEERSADWTVAAWMAALDNGKAPEADIAAPPRPLDAFAGRPERANPPSPPMPDAQTPHPPAPPEIPPPLVHDQGVDLKQVQGTGAGRRVTVHDLQGDTRPEAKPPLPSPILIDQLSPFEYAKKALIEGVDKKTVSARIRTACNISESEAAALTEKAAGAVALKLPPTRPPDPKQPPIGKKKDSRKRPIEMLGWGVLGILGAIAVIGFVWLAFWFREYALQVVSNGIELLREGQYAAGIMVLAFIVGIWWFLYKIFKS
jgi:hypothetical protein